MTINLHDKFGRIDLTLIDPADVAKLSDEQQAVLAIVCEAVQNREAAHERLRIAKEKVREAMRAEADAFAANQLANPPQTRLEALRAAQDAYNGVAPEKPKSHPKFAKLRPAVKLRKAQEATIAAQDELRAATGAAQRAERNEGEAMAELLAIIPAPSQEDVAREMIAKQNAARAERVSKGLPAEEPTAPRVVGSPIDQIFADRAKNSHRLSRKRVNHPPIRGPLFKV